MSKDSVSSVVDLGKALQQYGWNVGENPAFGTGHVGTHAPGSYHYSGQALDITDTRPEMAAVYPGGEKKSYAQRIGELKYRLKQAGIGDEILGPGDVGHKTHVHFAAGNPFQVTPEMKQWIATGRVKTPEGGLTDVMPGSVAQTTQQTQQSQSPGNTYIFVSRSPKQESSAQDLLAEYAKQFMPGSGSLPGGPDVTTAMQNQIATTLQSVPEFFT